MYRLPPRSTRTDTRVPDTPLFRSPPRSDRARARLRRFRHCVRRCGARDGGAAERLAGRGMSRRHDLDGESCGAARIAAGARSEEHTSELQSLMRISYAVFCLKKKKYNRRSESTVK